MDYRSGNVPLYPQPEQIELSVADAAGDKTNGMKGEGKDGRT